MSPIAHPMTARSSRKLVLPIAFYAHKLKRFLEDALPEAYGALRKRWYEHELYQMLKTIAERRLVVQSGPFAGMQYLPELLTPRKVIQYALLPKIVGCYESQLHSVLAQVPEHRYSKVVNIGCAEGYYAIGLSRRLPNASIFAFDIDRDARQLCERMACLNSVQDRVVVGGKCTKENLQLLAGPGTLIVCDCEGCELGLLRPELVSGLRACDFIIELHDHVNPGISKIVPQRFAHTHKVTALVENDRDPSAFPSLRDFSPYKQRLAISETRWGAPGVWSFMTTMPGANL